MSAPHPAPEPTMYRFTRGHLWGLLLAYEVWLKSHSMDRPERSDPDAYARWLLEKTRDYITLVALEEAGV